MRHFFYSILLLLMIFRVVSAQGDSPYQNPDLPIDERVADLLGQMTLDEKIGQMTLVEKNSITPAGVRDYFIGGVLSGGSGYPAESNSPSAWMQMVHGFQDGALATRLGIPMIYGVDAVHGHNNLSGAVIFPHNIGLGATRNAELVEAIGQVTALEMIATGIYWNYAPVLAVPQDIRWGRTYEGYSENTELVSELSSALIRGLQGDDLSAPDTVLATPKHFVGDGGTAFGSSSLDNGFLDQGVTDIDEATLRAIHLPPYIAAIDNHARSIMISFSSWGGKRMHAQDYLIQDVLREELGFTGFIVSDWGGVDQVSADYYDAVVQSINAGIDMNMVPYDAVLFIHTMKQAIENGDIAMQRVDEAVSNILRVKFELGLFERPYGDEKLIDSIGSERHRSIAREAVSQSLVLLKNANSALPISTTDEQTILVAGAAADSIGIQSGGWTIEWQGSVVDLTPGTTLLEAIQADMGEATTLHYSPNASFADAIQGDVGIVIIGEYPYAEMIGDTPVPGLPQSQLNVVANMREKVDRLIVVLISGRPIVITEQLNLADAFVAVWLPGTEGAGVTDVLFGERDFVGKLPYTWLRDVSQLPFDFDTLPTEGCDAPLFPYGYGLTYAFPTDSTHWLELAESCADF